MAFPFAFESRDGFSLACSAAESGSKNTSRRKLIVSGIRFIAERIDRDTQFSQPKHTDCPVDSFADSTERRLHIPQAA